MQRRVAISVVVGALLLTGCGSAAVASPPISTPSVPPAPGDALRVAAIPATAFPTGFTVKTDRILDIGAPQFSTDPAFHSALTSNGFVVAYLRYGELPLQGGLSPSGVVELYRFPSDTSAGNFASALGATLRTSGATLTDTTVIPGGKEYALHTGNTQSVTVVGVRNGVAFQVTLSGTTDVTSSVEHLAKQQYDRL